MNIEQKLILGLLGNASESEIESYLAQNPDWTVFSKTAAVHRVIPPIYQNIRRLSIELPAGVANSLRARAKKSAMRNLEFTAELNKLAQILEAHDIEFLAYKGLTLAELAYGDPGLRSFGDLDLFIRKQDFPKVKRAILENGGGSFWTLTDKQEQAVLKYYYEYPFFLSKKRLLIEIHWAFMESFFGFDYEKEDVFGRSQTVSVHGKDFRTLSNEDLLIVLCVHGSKHYWKRLSWIYDIAKLVETQPIDWDMTLRLAKKFGSVRMLLLGAFMAKELFSLDLPQAIEQKIDEDKNIIWLAEELKLQIFDDEVSSEAIRSKIHMRMLDRWRDKFTYSQRLFRTKVIDSIFMPMGRPI